jgi:hypothetical protein
MQEIRKDTKQIIMTDEERLSLYNELERAFVRLDVESPKGMFFPDILTKNYPLLVKLFKIVECR